MRLALIGFGNAGKAFARLVHGKRMAFPFRIVGAHTRRGTALDIAGIGPEPVLGPPMNSVEAFLDACEPEIAIEISSLNPETGEPATSHIRAAFARRISVVTANKGPIAHSYATLRDEAHGKGVQFRFESTVMDGAPVFNMVRHTLPGVEVRGFTGILSSTTKLVIEAMEEGASFEEGVRRAQSQGIAEADPSFDLDGWDSAVKTAALANVLMDARINPGTVAREGIRGFAPGQVQELARQGQTVRLISECKREGKDLHLRVYPAILRRDDVLAAAPGASNLLLLHTDLMGTIGTISIAPGPEQTAYGIFSDIVDIAKTL